MSLVTFINVWCQGSVIADPPLDTIREKKILFSKDILLQL